MPYHLTWETITATHDEGVDGGCVSTAARDQSVKPKDCISVYSDQSGRLGLLVVDQIANWTGAAKRPNSLGQVGNSLQLLSVHEGMWLRVYQENFLLLPR